MNKKTVTWAVGSALFAGIVGFWAYNLPDALRYATAGKSDDDIKAMVNTFNGDGSGVSSDLREIQKQFDERTAELGNAIRAEQDKAAAISDLKEKIMERTNANLNANAPAQGGSASGGNTNAPTP